jgi:hypothetical protein
MHLELWTNHITIEQHSFILKAINFSKYAIQWLCRSYGAKHHS